MKKKILLGLLPALLVLSSCQAVPNVGNETGPRFIPEDQQFLEDTEAHDEIFGDSVLSGDLGVRKMPSIPATPADDSIPTVGIQYKEEDEDYVSFRFVAAIKVADHDDDGDVDADDLAVINVKWIRGIFKGDGTPYKTMNTDLIVSTKAYTSLAAKNNVDLYSIEDLNTAKGTHYTHFVTYTVLHVPVAHPDYYFLVNVNYEDTATSTIRRSDPLITSIDRKTQFVSADMELGYNLIKKTSSGFTRIDPAGEPGSGNLAKFEDVALNADESIIVVYYYMEIGGGEPDFNTMRFKVYNYNDKGTNGSYFFAAEEGFAKVNFKATYTFTLTDAGKINVSAEDIVRPIWVKIEKDESKLWWWGNDDRFTALYAFDETVNPKREAWFTLHLEEYHPNENGSGGYLLYKTYVSIDPTEYNTVIVVEMKSSAREKAANELSWSDQNDGNQSENEVIPDTTEDCVFVYGTSKPFASSFGNR